VPKTKKSVLQIAHHVFGGKKTGEGAGHQTVRGSILDVVAGGICRLLSTPIVMFFILQREREGNMSTGRWTEHDAWTYRGGRE
jgi:hypothetical protein